MAMANEDGATSTGEYYCIPEATSSTSITHHHTATFDFVVTDYLQLKGMGVGEFVASSVFKVGGYKWELNFYPDGITQYRCGDNTSCYVRYLGGAKDVKAKIALSMLRTSSQAEVVSWRAKEYVFSQQKDERGRRRFVSRWRLKSLSREGEGDGCFTIRCVLTVSKETPLVLQGKLEPWIGDGRGADVTFRVGGQEFPGHRVLLASQSPVFEAQLFGPMAEKDMGRVKVVDVEPTIFQMMLHYIYTDSLPPCHHRDGYSVATLQHLLVAADRYGLSMLRLMCEEELCEKIDVKTVRSTFALANQHNCERLKSDCLWFMSSPKVLGAVLETEGFKEHFMPSCRPMALEEGASGKKCRRREEKTDPNKKKIKKIRTKQ
ncbi:hypothetical protein ACQJBY_011874 [Aegilops geniculata]